MITVITTICAKRRENFENFPIIYCYLSFSFCFFFFEKKTNNKNNNNNHGSGAPGGGQNRNFQLSAPSAQGRRKGNPQTKCCGKEKTKRKRQITIYCWKNLKIFSALRANYC